MSDPDKPTAAELRADFTADVNAGLIKPEAIESVNFDLLAANLADTSNRVVGWSAPTILPPLWEAVPGPPGLDGTRAYESRVLKLKAMLSCTMFGDEQFGRHPWLHLSVSHKGRIPTWREMGEAKRVFLGDREAYQVIPPKERYVNINERVLHMFALLDPKATALPDFTCGTGSL